MLASVPVQGGRTVHVHPQEAPLQRAREFHYSAWRDSGHEHLGDVMALQRRLQVGDVALHRLVPTIFDRTSADERHDRNPVPPIIARAKESS
jgi:hypothetical protein